MTGDEAGQAHALFRRVDQLLAKGPIVGHPGRREVIVVYAMGAAYIIDPDPESEDAREQRGFRLLEELGLRERGEDLTRTRTKGRRLGGEANHCVFSNRRVVPGHEVHSRRAPCSRSIVPTPMHRAAPR